MVPTWPRHSNALAAGPLDGIVTWLSVVLQGFATLAQQTFRESDLVARWGGEEFLVLMPHTEPGDAMLALQRLLTAFRAARFDAVDPSLRVTVSAGAATLATGDTVSTLIERADQALYSAKMGGRDRIVLAAATPVEADTRRPFATPSDGPKHVKLQGLATPASGGCGTA